MIHEVDINPVWVKQAEKEASDLGILNNSIRSGKGNLIGFLGELIFCYYFGAIRENTYDYDAKIDDHRIDVKTKETTVKPELYFNATVANYNTRQDCDSYYFVRIHNSLQKAWLLGGIQKQTFYQKATFNKKGDIDTTSTQNWTFKASCYNLPLSVLVNPEIGSESIYWP